MDNLVIFITCNIYVDIFVRSVRIYFKIKCSIKKSCGGILYINGGTFFSFLKSKNCFLYLKINKNRRQLDDYLQVESSLSM